MQLRLLIDCSWLYYKVKCVIFYIVIFIGRLIMKVDVKKELLDERLPVAFDKALMVSKKAETLIYMVLEIR